MTTAPPLLLPPPPSRPGSVPLQYSEDVYIGGTQICHFSIAKTELMLALKRTLHDGVDTGSNGETSMRSSDLSVVFFFFFFFFRIHYRASRGAEPHVALLSVCVHVMCISKI